MAADPLMTLALFGALLDQLEVTIGFNAGYAITTWWDDSKSADIYLTRYDQSELFLAALVGLLAFAGSYCTGNRPMQTMVFMLASRLTTDALPLPEEPSGQLLIPSIAVYLFLSSTVLWCLQRLSLVTNKAYEEYARSFVNGVSPFVVVFTCVRAISRFVGNGYGDMLACITVCIIVVWPDETTATPDDGRWYTLFMRFVNSFACQGIVQWLKKKAMDMMGGEGFHLACLYIVVLLVLEVLRLGNVGGRVQFCRNNFCYSVSHQLLTVLQDKTGFFVSLWSFFAGLSIMSYFSWGPCYQNTVQVFVTGLSLSLAALLSQWSDAVNCRSEKLVLFGGAFVLLQLCVDCKNEMLVKLKSNSKTESSNNSSSSSSLAAESEYALKHHVLTVVIADAMDAANLAESAAAANSNTEAIVSTTSTSTAATAV